MIMVNRRDRNGPNTMAEVGMEVAVAGGAAAAAAAEVAAVVAKVAAVVAAVVVEVAVVAPAAAVEVTGGAAERSQICPTTSSVSANLYHSTRLPGHRVDRS
jgi:hypothetical protein